MRLKQVRLFCYVSIRIQLWVKPYDRLRAANLHIARDQTAIARVPQIAM